MPPKKLLGRTFFKHEMSEKVQWKNQAKKEKSKNLSLWIRSTLNKACI